MWIKTKRTKRRKKKEITMSLICLHNRVMQHMKQQRIGTIFYCIIKIPLFLIAKDCFNEIEIILME